MRRAATIATAVDLGCRGIAVEWHALDRAAVERAHGRGPRRGRVDRPPPADVRPPRTARASARSASRRPRSTAERRVARLTGRARRGSRGATSLRGHPASPPILRSWRTVEHADLVVVGAGTVGGWASWFAKTAGAGRVVVLERGLVGQGASSRAAGIVRAQGGTPTTVALGRWSIDFYRRQAAEIGTDSGFRELGYLILAVTEDDERRGRERVAMQQAAGARRPLADGERGGRRDPERSPRSAIAAARYLETDGHIDPPRNVRAYSLAMQQAGVELRERTAFTGLRLEPLAGRRPTRRRRRDERRHRSRPSA